METAKPVPQYDRAMIHSGWWYCLYCRKSSVGEYELKTHVRIVHYPESANEYEPEKGEDYTNGTHLRILLERWDLWSLRVIDRFHAQVDSLRGADDFELEVGDGIPE